jgi:hypothetical protein
VDTYADLHREVGGKIQRQSETGASSSSADFNAGLERPI